jgi:hypothetical protein
VRLHPNALRQLATSYGSGEGSFNAAAGRTLGVLLAGLVLSACVSHGHEPSTAGRDRDRNHTVSVVGALIAPGKTNRKKWDAGSVVDQAVVNDLARAMAVTADPYAAAAAVVGAVATGVAGASESPDIVGRAELWVGGKRVSALMLTMQHDTFTPQWPSVTWENVDIDNARIRVVLEDADVVRNDDVGIAEIGADELKAAAAAGRVYPVRVDGQTNGQILFLNISVM